MPAYLEQVQAEFRALVDGQSKGEASIPFYDPADFNYRPVGSEKLVGCLEGVNRVEVRNTGRYFRVPRCFTWVA